jgi:hypothetical protein
MADESHLPPEQRSGRLRVTTPGSGPPQAVRPAQPAQPQARSVEGVTKLTPRIVRRRPAEEDGMEHIDVEWHHPKGKTLDQVTVRRATSDEKVMEILEEKRKRLAQALGVQP